MAKIDSSSTKAADISEESAIFNNWSAINPLIDKSGDTAKVQAVLNVVSFMLLNSDDQGEITLTSGVSFGLSCLLDTCGAALAYMQGPVNHG